ncbi:MAG TPA: HD-GYP domain-containing protein [Coriobacteriia bacterium]|nr:HD-GYP domain-containing protein [Coriobacteriia bacterium]
MTDAPLRPENDGPLESPEQLASEARSVQPSFVAVQAPFATPERLEMARELVRTIAVAHTNAALYPTTHPLVSTTLGDLVRAVQSLVTSGFSSVSLNIYKGTLFVENQVFPEESVTYRRLIEECLDRGVSAITFIEGTTETDAASLIELLAQSRITDIENATRFLEQKGATHVTVAETTTLDSGEEQNQEARHRARDSYEAGLNSMRDIEAQAKLGKTMEIGSLQRVVESLLDNLLQDPAAVLALAAIKGHDDYTLNHSLNVCVLALSLGSALGLPAEDLRSLGLAGLLYDIGKVRIAEDILAKAGPLTATEWQEVKRHTEEGADLLKRLQLADKMPMIVAYEHHQRYDMMGYPEAASDSEQHVFSRVVSVCDAYDAMTTNRPFRREIRPDKALAVLMQGRGKAYDPTVTKALVAMLGIYPMGAVVRLDDRSIAVVYRVNNDDLLHPRVKLLIDPSGAWREAPEMLDLRLVDPITGEAVRSIVEAIPAAEAGVDDVWQYL